MKQFENGDEVECKVFDAWLNSTIIGLNPSDNSQYIVMYNELFKSEACEVNKGELDYVSGGFIRPVQLICDEAEDIIKQAILSSLENQLDEKRKSNTELRYECREKDAEISRLRESNKILNHSISVIAQEKDQWKELCDKM